MNKNTKIIVSIVGGVALLGLSYLAYKSLSNDTVSVEASAPEN